MVRCLLDTHALAWWLMDSPCLPAAARRLIENRDNAIFVSAVSAYEASHKHHRGRWPEVASLVNAFEEIVAAEGFELLPLTAKHAVRAGAFGREHRDPFDRMIAAQAVVEGMVLVSKDKVMREMGAEVVWGSATFREP
jgi:PIN domain nuclease of toxin-antitoxin system